MDYNWTHPGTNREDPKGPLTFEADTNCDQRPVITHDPYTKMPCEICNKSPSTLSDHVKTFHTNEEQQSCDQASFSTTNLQNDTKAVHSTGERFRFPCTFLGCNKSYLSKYQVTRHKKIQHSVNPARYPCTVCGKKFKRMSHLRTHNLTHTKEKPHKCTTCGRSFAQVGSMKRHEAYSGQSLNYLKIKSCRRILFPVDTLGKIEPRDLQVQPLS
ncbi:zinc finger protein 675 isoform X2 [Folsomia candida]|uniref:zinc finger protein 675 isoform X2 n=1 Tax=Folsomia candida TaxID=158441 RepID=UPI001604B5C9|nr:zinc finger protein 675 isoform X2 [Folsomia candida]